MMLEQLFISFQIILIDIVMAADNAIIIGLIAANFAPNNRKKIIAWGVAAAFIFRIIFAFSASWMFEFAWIKILGGVLLLWVINNIRQDLFNQKRVRSPLVKSNETVSFTQGVYRVLIADLTLSFDNVLGVVGAAKDNYHLLVVGLLLSVFLIATLASYFADYIKKHQWLGYVGIFVILIIAIQLIIGGFVNYEILSINEKYKFLFSI
jgi:YjbE family integral membrane protein